MMPCEWTGCHGWNMGSSPAAYSGSCCGSGSAWSYAPPWSGGPTAGAFGPIPGIVLPKELEANPDTTSASEVVGGSVAVWLCVEYMSSGSGASSVKLTAKGSAGTFSWDDSTIADGYHVKRDCPACSPGTTIKIEAQNAILRVRWLEISGVGENH